MQSSLMSMLPLVLMFVVLYFVMIRPQMKKQKEHRAMVDALAKGVKVETMGGRDHQFAVEHGLVGQRFK